VTDLDALDLDDFDIAEGLDVVEVGADTFAGRYPRWFPGERVFGGLVLAQATAAMCRTVDDGIPLHSIHGHFLRPATPRQTSEVVVERVRDGRSFVTRRATVRVEGKETFVVTASFHVPEEGEGYQLAVADVDPPPGDVSSPSDLNEPFELVELGPSPRREDGTYESTRRAWVRCVADLGDEPRRHVAAAAYASDMTRAAFRPTSLGTWGGHVDASLDHAVWFHRQPAMDQWHLFDLHTVITGGNRSFIRGQLSDADGRLVFSMAQEILIRPLATPVVFDFDDPFQRPESP
jgi:acyl-CoA thioesterase-2